jgi:hypothetical protein
MLILYRGKRRKFSGNWTVINTAVSLKNTITTKFSLPSRKRNWNDRMRKMLKIQLQRHVPMVYTANLKNTLHNQGRVLEVKPTDMPLGNVTHKGNIESVLNTADNMSYHVSCIRLFRILRILSHSVYNLDILISENAPPPLHFLIRDGFISVCKVLEWHHMLWRKKYTTQDG